MKILFTQETDWFKRGPHQQHHLADRLSLRGHEIRVIDYEFTWRNAGEKELFSRRQVFSDVHKTDSRARVTVVRPAMLKIPFLDYVSLLINHRKEIARQIKEFKPDVIVGYGILNSWLAARAAKRNGIPFVYYWIDVLHRLIPVRLLQPLGEALEKNALKNSSLVLVINEKLGDYVVSLGAKRESVRLIRAGIDIDKFDLRVNGSRVRQKYHIKPKEKVIFFMGWLYHFSGLKEVALKLAENNNSGLKMLVVGEGDALPDLEKIKTDHLLFDSLILTGKQPYEEIQSFVAASDICMLPAYTHEPIMQDIVPIKLYEYMAMKKPVIATRLHGVMREFGEDNGVVFVDKPEDVIGQALAVISSGLCDDLGEKARKFVEKNTWEKITDEFEEVLEGAVMEKVK